MATRSNRGSRSNRANGRSSSTSRQSGKDVPDYSMIDPKEIDEAVDVYVDAPVVNVDEIKFELDDLRAHLAVLAEAGHFVAAQRRRRRSGSARSSSRSRASRRRRCSRLACTT